MLITCILIAKFQDSFLYTNQAEVVINLDNLNSTQIITSIENDFNKLNGVQFIDASLMTHSVILKVNNNIEVSDIENLFNKWGCKIKDINYRILNLR